MVATLEGRSAPEVAGQLQELGVLTIAMDARTLRLVTHRDVDEEDCARAVAAIDDVLS